jgi:lysophospholipase L1-like esterase
VNTLKEKKGILAIVALSIILLVALFLGKREDDKLMDKNSKEYQEWVNTSKDEKVEHAETVEVQKETSETAKVISLNFYAKLDKKEKVKVLIAGDRIALSEGKNSENGIWSAGVSYIINKNYGSEVEVNLLASKNLTIKEGSSLISKSDITANDLIILCFGHNDSVASVNIQDFKSVYNKIISDIKSKNQNQILLLMIPSTLEKDDKYREAILQVANESGLAYIDPKDTQEKSGVPKKNMLNGKLPNDIGYQMYTESISNIIREELIKTK